MLTNAKNSNRIEVKWKQAAVRLAKSVVRFNDDDFAVLISQKDYEFAKEIIKRGDR